MVAQTQKNLLIIEKYIETAKMQLIFNTGDCQYPYLLEITEFVKNSDNPNNYNGERQFRLLDKNFIATGDGFSFSFFVSIFLHKNIKINKTHVKA